MSTDSSQNMNFNPSWMQPSAPLKNERPNGLLYRSATEDVEEMIDPVFANHRYGREDILALIGKDSSKPPDGLEKCPFFTEKAQTPIILSALNDNENRLQQNINSSKALSALNRQDRHHMMNGSETGSPSSNPVNNSGWVVAGSNRGGGGTASGHSHKPSPNRWSALAPSAGNPKSTGDAALASSDPYFSKRSMPGGVNNSGQSTYNKPGAPRANNSEHRITNSRYRMPSTSKDQAAPLNENVAKLLESQPATPPSTSTSNIWAKIGIKNKDTEEIEKASVPDIGRDSKEKPEWFKFSSSNSQPQPQEDFDRDEGLPKPVNHAKSASPPSNNSVFTGGFGNKTRPKPEMTVSELEAGFRKVPENDKGYSVTNYAPVAIVPPVLSESTTPKPQPSPQTVEIEKWYYLDPSGIQQGPFEVVQMQAWYDNKYFSESLRLRRVSDSDYTTLGNLFHINGKTSPFTFTSTPGVGSGGGKQSPRVVDAASIWTSLANTSISASTASSILPDFSTILADGTSGGNQSGSTSLNKQQDIDNERQILLMKEMQIREEERKLREKEKNMRREDREREDRERRMREKEIELGRKQQELQRLAMEKEREIEKKRLEMAEFERQKREDLERREEKLRREHQHQLRLQEEEERRRLREREVEARKKIEADEARMRLAYEEACRLQKMALEAAKKVEEEQRLRLHKEAEDAKAKEEADRKRKKQEEIEQKKLQEQQRKEDALRQQQMEEELNRAVIEALLNESNPIPVEKAPPTPWVTVGTAKPAVKKGSSSKNGAEKQPPQKSLLEIQEEEKKAMQLKLQKQEELLEAHRKNAQAAQQQQQTSAQKSAWGSPTQVYPSSLESLGSQVQPNKKKGSTAQSSGGRSWNPVPVSEPTPIPKAKSQQQMQTKVQKLKQKVEIKLVIDTPKKSDAFTTWIIRRVKELNSSVDAEVFASFIEGVDSPNEAEDYIIGYLGESKGVKEFHREFLQKRIELRPRLRPTSKDDLSGPAAAFSSSAGSNGNNSLAGSGQSSSVNNNSNSYVSSSVGSACGNGAGKKKKKGGKVKMVLDAATLGFRPAGDPNRVNAGEIDTAAPVPARKNR